MVRISSSAVIFATVRKGGSSIRRFTHSIITKLSFRCRGSINRSIAGYVIRLWCLQMQKRPVPNATRIYIIKPWDRIAADAIPPGPGSLKTSPSCISGAAFLFSALIIPPIAPFAISPHPCFALSPWVPPAMIVTGLILKVRPSPTTYNPIIRPTAASATR